MIKSLSIKNIALIDTLDIEFVSGMNVLSGETGAGKSIIIDSLNFVLGDRADRSLIRHGQSFASVEAIFDVYGNKALDDYLFSLGIEGDDILIVSRVLSDNGRNECRINRKIVNLSALREVVKLLVDIHSQNEHQSLLNVQNHIKLLDAYSKTVQPLKAEYSTCYNDYQRIVKEISSFADASEREREMDILSFQIEEIKKLKPEEGEEAQLIALRSKLNNTERILHATAGAVEALTGERDSAIIAISAALAHLKQIEEFDENYTELIERLESASIEISDVSDTIKSFADIDDYNETDLGSIEKRLREIRDIKRKYGQSVAEIETFLAKAESEYVRLKNASDRLAELSSLKDNAGHKLVKIALSLHDARVSESKQLSAKIVQNICQLGMKDSSFDVAVVLSDDIAKYSSDGADSVEFLISPNKGEPLKPLHKIASGGELSRFMLALKTIIADLDDIDTLIFDEIDTGISGNVARVVAEKLSQISKDRQVIVVTHLAQIAAMSDKQFLISKDSDEVKTTTSVETLSEEETILEIVRLSGGVPDSAASVAHAKELLNWATTFKEAR